MFKLLMTLGISLAALTAAPAAANDALRAQMALQRVAHLSYDADLLVSLQADGFVVVDAGQVMRPTRAEGLERFRRYFSAVRFLAWDDIEPPVVTLSPDGRMATVIVTKLVRLTNRSESDNSDAEVAEGRFAWLEIWRLGPDGWRMTQLASTRAP